MSFNYFFYLKKFWVIIFSFKIIMKIQLNNSGSTSNVKPTKKKFSFKKWATCLGVPLATAGAVAGVTVVTTSCSYSTPITITTSNVVFKQGTGNTLTVVVKNAVGEWHDYKQLSGKLKEGFTSDILNSLTITGSNNSKDLTFTAVLNLNKALPKDGSKLIIPTTLTVNKQANDEKTGTKTFEYTFYLTQEAYSVDFSTYTLTQQATQWKPDGTKFSNFITNWYGNSNITLELVQNSSPYFSAFNGACSSTGTNPSELTITYTLKDNNTFPNEASVKLILKIGDSSGTLHTYGQVELQLRATLTQ